MPPPPQHPPSPPTPPRSPTAGAMPPTAPGPGMFPATAAAWAAAAAWAVAACCCICRWHCRRSNTWGGATRGDTFSLLPPRSPFGRSACDPLQRRFGVPPTPRCGSGGWGALGPPPSLGSQNGLGRRGPPGRWGPNPPPPPPTAWRAAHLPIYHQPGLPNPNSNTPRDGRTVPPHPAVIPPSQQLPPTSHRPLEECTLCMRPPPLIPSPPIPTACNATTASPHPGTTPLPSYLGSMWGGPSPPLRSPP